MISPFSISMIRNGMQRCPDSDVFTCKPPLPAYRWFQGRWCRMVPTVVRMALEYVESKQTSLTVVSASNSFLSGVTAKYFSMGANGSSIDSRERIPIGPYSIKKKRLLGEGR